MKKIMLLFIFLLVIENIHAITVNISIQSEWDNYIASVSPTIPSDDIVIIEAGAAVVTSTGISLNGTIINYGSFTNGSALSNFGTFHNAGTFINNSAYSIFNIMTNTGTVINNVAFSNLGGTFFSCTDLGFIPTDPAVPIGTPCDDGDPGTTNDGIISNQPCECGDLSQIPTLSQWGIIVLSMIMMIFGIVGVRNRKALFS